MALKNDETPVGCVFVRDGEIIGRGMNDTNKSLNVRKADDLNPLGLTVSRALAMLSSSPSLRYSQSILSACFARRIFTLRLNHASCVRRPCDNMAFDQSTLDATTIDSEALVES